MDATDVRIFCEMAFVDLNYGGGAPRHLSPLGVSKKLGLDEKTVRLRVRKMEESGFIKYYQATPNLALFGMKYQGMCRFEAMNVATKRSVVKSIQDLYGVVEAFDYLGPVVSLSIAGPSREDIQKREEEVAARAELTWMSFVDHPLREPRQQLGKLDWQIIEKLRYDARATSKEVAELLSVTPRMSAYRIERLVESGAVVIRPVIDAQRQEGLVFYELIVFLEGSRQNAVVRKVQDMLGQRIWSMNAAPNSVLLVDLFSFTLAEPEDVAMSLLDVEGVKYCSASILKEIIEPKRPNWIDLLTSKKIDAGR